MKVMHFSVRNAADTDYVNFIAKNATFKGDLLVEGQSFVTEAETVEIKDNLLLLNKGEVGSGVTKGIAGLEIDRGTEPNYFIIFDESDNRFKAGVEGDLWNLALRESDDNMLNGYFISWNSKDKILSTTNIVKESTPLLFGRTDYKQYSGNRTDPGGNYSSYAFISEAEGNHLYNFSGSSNWNIDTDKINFRFWKPLLGTTFKRASDNSEVLYHADIVNNLTSGGTNKVLSAEQGKLLQNSITRIQGSYLPLIGGTLTGQLTIKQSVDIKLRLQSTDADNHCIIQAINAQASQLGVFGYAGDKWAIGHNGTYYEIWDKYNLTDPVTYTTNAYNHATLKNKNGQYFTYIKAGTNGLLPHSKATLTSGGSGSLGTSDQSFNAAYINNLHTNKITFGETGPYITGSTSATQFLDANGGAQKVATGGLYVGVSYVSDALNLVPTNGIYSTGVIKSAAGFTSNFRQTNLNLAKTGNDVLYISSFVLDSTGAPGTDSNTGRTITDGMFLTYFWQNDHAFQLAADIDGTGIAYRHYIPSTGNSTTGWKFLADTNWVVSKINSSTSNYLPLTGGNLTGKLSIKSSGSNLLILDSSSSTESVIHFLRSSTAKGAVGYYDNIGAFIYNFPSNTYLFVKNDGKPYVGTRTNYEKILTETDITGYATQSWVNNQGYLTSHQTIYNLTFQAGTFAAKTFDPNGAAATVNIPTNTSHLTNDSGFITSSALNGYATQSWANGQFAPLKNYFVTSNYASIATTGNEMCIGSLTSGNSIINVNYRNGTGTTSPSTWYWRAGSSTTWANAYWGNLYMNNNLVATQTWSNSQYPLKTGTGASGTWDINISGNASTASAASKLGSTTIGGSAKPIYLSSGTPTACSATVGSATVPVYMNAGTITQCSTTLGVSITGNAATATNATQLGGTAASSYVKANDNISRLTNDSGYTTQEWVNGQGFLTSDSILDKFVPTTGGYIRNSDQVLLRLQRTGVSTGTSRTIEMYFDDSNTDGTSTTPRGSIGYNSEVGMFLYSAMSKSFIAMEHTGRPFYGTPENRYYLLGTNRQHHDLDGYQRIGNIMIQWGYFTVQGNSTRAVNFPVSFTNTVWSVTGSWDNTATGSQENWGFTNYTSSGFTIINGDGSDRIFHYIAIGPFTGS